MNPIRFRFLPFTVLLLLGLLLQGCGTRPTIRPGEPATEETAASAEAAGEFVLAAREYERLAQTATSPTKEHYTLRSIENLIRAAQIQQARQRLDAVSVKGLDYSFLARKRLLQSRITLLEGDARKALKQLRPIRNTKQLDPALQGDIHWVKAQALSRLGENYAAARFLIARSQFLVTPEETLANQRELWIILTSMSETELASRMKKEKRPITSAWLSLAHIGVKYADSRHAIVRGVKAWLKEHPKHPVDKEFLNEIMRAETKLIGRVNNIALLLPMTSRHKRAAEAVRDGFMAMDAANTKPEKPVVRLYDIGEDPKEVAKVYKQAVKDGADFVVGPLGVDATQAVIDRTNLERPTLLLSHSDERIGAANIFQFALSPEQEAEQVAERAYLEGHRMAAVLFPNNPLGERMSKAFSKYWETLGGLVVQSTMYDAKAGDHADALKGLLNITQGEERRIKLRLMLKRPIKYEARIRSDIDFIFLAADRSSARLVKPQLSFHQARHLPVYATSHVYSGKPNRREDQDLSGIIFGDMPWMLLSDGHINDIKQRLQQDWPYSGTVLDRLYALGVDSYAVIPYLNRIGSGTGNRFNGVTSSLSLTPSGRLHRQLVWAQFRGGKPRLLDTGISYQEQLGVE